MICRECGANIDDNAIECKFCGAVYGENASEEVSEQVETETVSEEMRVLYVALTRAKEKLYLFSKRTESCTFKKYL